MELTKFMWTRAQTGHLRVVFVGQALSIRLWDGKSVSTTRLRQIPNTAVCLCLSDEIARMFSQLSASLMSLSHRAYGFSQGVVDVFFSSLQLGRNKN